MILDTILIKVASICNLNCSYCYVYHGEDTSHHEQPSLMPQKVIQAIIKSLTIQSKEQKEGFAIVLHGGEPLLLSFELLEELLISLRNILPDYRKYPIAIQSNGILVTKEILDLLSLTKTTISISLDGTKYINDIARVDHSFNSTFNDVLNSITLLQSHKDSTFIFTGILSVIHPFSSPLEIYNFYKKLNLPSANFLLQDGNHNRLPIGKKNFNSTEYGDWIKSLITIYLSDNKPTFVIPFIDDLIKVALGEKSIKEGIGESNYSILIIETNGEIRKNDTLRTAYDGADFLDERPNILRVPIAKVLKSNEFMETCKMQTALVEECLKCEFMNVCGGGMPLYRWSLSNGYNNPSVYCNDHKLYISMIQSILKES